ARLERFVTQGLDGEAYDVRQANPFALARHLTDERAHVRAAAAASLRSLFAGAPTPRQVLRALLDHPDPLRRAAAATCRIDPEEFERAVRIADDESLRRLQRANLDAISADDRQRAADRLYRRALARPEADPAPLDDLWGAPGEPLRMSSADWRRHPAADDALGLAMLTTAIRLHPDTCRWLLGLAVNTDEPHQRDQALLAVHNFEPESRPAPAKIPRHYVGEPLPANLAPLALRLLDAPDPEDRWSAACILTRATQRDVDPGVRDAVVPRALDLLRDGDRRLGLARRRIVSGCGLMGPNYGPPADAAAQIVFLASRLGDTALIAPLLERLTRPDETDTEFVTACLTMLVPHMDAASCRATYDALAAIAGQLMTEVGVLANEELVEQLLQRAPKDVFRKFAPLLSDRASLGALQIAYRCRHQLPPADLRAALATTPLLPRGRSAVLVAHPERLAQLADVPRGRERAIEAIRHALATAPTLSLAEARALPRPLLVASLRHSRKPVPLPVLDLAAADLIEGGHLRDLVRLVSTAEHGADPLPQWRGIAAHDAVPRWCVATRAASLGEHGRNFARLLLEQGIERPRPEAAVETAIRLDIEPRNLRKQLEQLPPQLRAMAAVQFFDATQATLGSAQTLMRYERLSREPIDPEAWRAADIAARYVSDALAGEDARRLPALRYVRGRSDWIHATWQRVLEATSADEADVRGAAYTALASRDREQWPFAWLAYEAALDDEPAVRACAPDAAGAQVESGR
ncbi:MAG: hypothetical protein KAI24_11680, partial [Planctomycetes bacterium]|nr:hypothetical protein [Planctomycetota bacterium]